MSLTSCLVYFLGLHLISGDFYLIIDLWVIVDFYTWVEAWAWVVLLFSELFDLIH